MVSCADQLLSALYHRASSSRENRKESAQESKLPAKLAFSEVNCH